MQYFVKNTTYSILFFNHLRRSPAYFRHSRLDMGELLLFLSGRKAVVTALKTEKSVRIVHI